MNTWYEWDDGWFHYYINKETGEKKFELDPEDILVEPPKLDDFFRREEN